jgi:ABC-type ATPase involved in cell division
MSAFQTVFIDDPIQQMDDMNAMSFIDIIMGLSQAGKQIVITTCHSDFFTLINQKMSQLAVQTGKTFKPIDLQALLVTSNKANTN